MKLINIKYFAFLFVILGIISCEKDDYTGLSKLTPTNPTLSVEGIDAGGYTLTEGGQKFAFTVNMSETQIVDVKLKVKQTAGDATPGVDYSYTSGVTIPAGSTSAVVEVTVLEDALREETETFTLTIGDSSTSNGSITPVNANFTILNLEAGDLAIDMSWETNVFEKIGLDLGPTEAADLRMLLIHADTIFAVADGGSFESFTITEDDPNGEYFVATDIYSVIDAGQFNAIFDIGMDLEFNQVGRINSQHITIPEALTSEFACEAHRTILAKVVKTDAAYDVSESYSKVVQPVEPKDGEFYGTDGYIINGGNKVEYASVVSVEGNMISGLNSSWMMEFWEEEIIEGGTVEFTLDGDGTFTIADQYLFTTLYEGDEYEYTISGSGTWADCGFPVLALEYTLDQEGFNPSAWLLENDLSDTDVFVAYISTDPTFKFVGDNTEDNILTNKPSVTK